jgi:hypothetical protein
MATTRSLRVLIRIWVISIWVLGTVTAQAATPGPMVTLPSGETVWDLTGDWDAVIENFGPNVSFGTYTNVHRFTQTGRVFSAVRVKDNPPPAPGEAGNPVWRGEMDRGGFKQVEMISSQGTVSPIKGQIGDDGKKIVIDDGWSIKVTLTRQ